ncbi:hypothetical protein PCLA_10f0084 [Pseudomonas citronellolis]|nr:hypothetical protein PCLA_10f0084 [Pseudomonas citronellolis]
MRKAAHEAAFFVARLPCRRAEVLFVGWVSLRSTPSYGTSCRSVGRITVRGYTPLAVPPGRSA